MILDAIAALLVFALGRRLFSAAVGVVAAMLFWIWPEAVLWQSTIEYGFRFATLDCGLGASVIALRVAAGGEISSASTTPRPALRRRRRIDLAALGLLLGLGFWCSPEIAYFAIPIAFVLGFRLIRRRLRLGFGGLVLVAAAMVVGGLPWIWANLWSNFSSFHPATQPHPQFSEHFQVFQRHALPIALGLQLHGDGAWIGGATFGRIMEVIAVVGAVLFLAWCLFEQKGRLSSSSFASPFRCCTLSLALFTWYLVRHGRYVLYTATDAGDLVGRRRGRGSSGTFRCLPARGSEREFLAFPVVVVLALALTLLGAYRLGPFRPDHVAGTPAATWTSVQSNPNDFEVTLADDLKRVGATQVFAGYWLAYPLTFVSGGSVTATDLLFARNPAYLREVSRARPSGLGGRGSQGVRVLPARQHRRLDASRSGLRVAGHSLFDGARIRGPASPGGDPLSGGRDQCVRGRCRLAEPEDRSQKRVIKYVDGGPISTMSWSMVLLERSLVVTGQVLKHRQTPHQYDLGGRRQMAFELDQVLAANRGENFSLYSRNINPQLVRVLRSIGFDRFYERGEGAYLYDDEGRRYLDFLAGFGVFALGRAHPVVKRALHDAIDRDLPNLVQMDAALLPGVLAKELLYRCHGGMGRVVFTNSGAEAVEAAIKFARYSTKRERIVHADHAFHGLTLGALSANGGTDFQKGFGPLLPGFSKVPFGDIDLLEAELRRRDVAACLVEPIQGKGVHVATQEYWSAVPQALCKTYGTLLICDEVQTGLGRTGKMWAYEHYGLEPDIITISKALSGGFVPVGAMISSTGDLRLGLLLDGTRRGALLDIQEQPAGDGRRSGDLGGAR